MDNDDGDQKSSSAGADAKGDHLEMTPAGGSGGAGKLEGREEL
jgi:hypothetical protein